MTWPRGSWVPGTTVDVARWVGENPLPVGCENRSATRVLPIGSRSTNSLSEVSRS